MNNIVKSSNVYSPSIPPSYSNLTPPPPLPTHHHQHQQIQQQFHHQNPLNHHQHAAMFNQFSNQVQQAAVAQTDVSTSSPDYSLMNQAYPYHHVYQATTPSNTTNISNHNVTNYGHHHQSNNGNANSPISGIGISNHQAFVNQQQQQGLGQINQMPPPQPTNLIYPWMRQAGNIKTAASQVNSSSINHVSKQPGTTSSSKNTGVC